MTAVVCLDLDRTIIYSAAALDLDLPDADAPRLLCVELYRGAPLSYMTETAADLLRELQGLATVVPTTTRTPEQLGRVHLERDIANVCKYFARAGVASQPQRLATDLWRRFMRAEL